MSRHFLEIDDLSPAELASVLDLAELREPPAVLKGQGVALMFEKPSARTRNSSEMAVVQLGGHPVAIASAEVGLGTRETPEDLARTLACYHRVIAARVYDHMALVRMAAAIDRAQLFVPVVNLLSDIGHPCQTLADLLTLRQHFGYLKGLSVAWIGDAANNVCHSLALGCALVGARLVAAAPPGFGLSAETISKAVALAGSKGVISESCDPTEAVGGVDAIVTDVWTSMGQESEAEERRRVFSKFQVDEQLVNRAPSHAVVLHCLPAHRGEEISGEVLDSSASLVWQEAGNRMHAMRGLLLWLMGSGTHEDNGDAALRECSGAEDLLGEQSR